MLRFFGRGRKVVICACIIALCLCTMIMSMILLRFSCKDSEIICDYIRIFYHVDMAIRPIRDISLNNALYGIERDKTTNEADLNNNPTITVLKTKTNFVFDIHNPVNLWRNVHSNINASGLYSSRDDIDGVLQAMRRYRIVGVESYRVRSSLKWLLKLEGGQYFIFKPKLIHKDQPLECVANCEKPESEVITFIVDRLLGYRRVPFTTMRDVNIVTEILPLASHDVISSFIQNGTDICVIYSCLYDKPRKYCFRNGIMTGALMYRVNLPVKEMSDTRNVSMPFDLIASRERWNKRLRAEYYKTLLGPVNNDTLCRYAKTLYPYTSSKFLLDLVDLSVLDYIVLHGDRKHSIAFVNESPMLSIHLDNGFAMCLTTPDTFPDLILSLVRLCCRIRLKTHQTLLSLQHTFDKKIVTLAGINETYALLSQTQLEEMSTRILYILDTVEICRKVVGQAVFVDE